MQSIAKFYPISQVAQEAMMTQNINSNDSVVKNPLNNSEDSGFIPYPMFNNYDAWDNWQIFREIYSNALDTQANVIVKLDNNLLTIQDFGSIGIKPRDLFFGNPDDKVRPINSIGMFGDGLKSAALVCSKKGYRVRIESVDYLYTVGMVELYPGLQTMGIFYERVNKSYDGTTVYIDGWADQTYEDRFLTENDYFYSNDAGALVKNKAGQIFVKNVFVKNNDAFYFGWNIDNLKMIKERDLISESDIKSNIASILESCENMAIWQQFFTLVKEGQTDYEEFNISLHSYNMLLDAKDIIKEAFESVFGDIVLSTSVHMANQAKHWGRDSISVDKFKSWGYTLQNIIKTDSDYVLEKSGRDFEVLSSHHIDDTQKESLKYLRKLADKVGFDRKNLKVARSYEFAGCFETKTGFIYIEASTLRNLSRSIDVFIHELGHWNSGADDLTDSHVNGITHLAGIIIESYMKHGK